MAINSGVAPHSAFVSTNGGTFPLLSGTVNQQATRKSSTFSGVLPMNFPGAAEAFAAMGENSTSITVSSVAGEGTLISGEIDAIDFKYIEGKIHFKGRDQSGMLHNMTTSQKFANMNGSQIAGQLAGMAGLGFSTDGGSGVMAGRQVQQDYTKLTNNLSFAAAIHQLSILDGARWWVQAGTLFYMMNGGIGGTYTINYEQPGPGGNSPPAAADFLTLSVHRNVQASKTANVTVNSWNPSKKQPYSGQATGGGSAGGSLNYNFNLPNLNQQQAQQYAQSRANNIARHGIRITAHTVGDPACMAGMMLLLSGTGFFDGSYEIDSVDHQFGMGGYTMTITARLPGDGGGG
jgi:hypothetical protein